MSLSASGQEWKAEVPQLWLELRGSHWYPHLTVENVRASVDSDTVCVDEYTGDGNWLTVFIDGTWLYELPRPEVADA